MSSYKSKGAGQVVEAFALAIQDFLLFYQHQVNDLERKAIQQRSLSQESSIKTDQYEGHYLSLIEIKVLMAPLLAQIQTIASICFTSKFIEDVEMQQQMNKGGKDLNDSADNSV